MAMIVHPLGVGRAVVRPVSVKNRRSCAVLAEIAKLGEDDRLYVLFNI